MIESYFHKTFSYSVKEIEAFNDVDIHGDIQLLKLRTQAGQEYFRSWIDLSNRKDKLFSGGDPTKWEIDFKEVGLSPNDVLKNKEIARTLMLPEASAGIKNMQKVFGYLNQQMLTQSEFLGKKRSKRYVRALSELCNAQILNATEVGFPLTPDHYNLHQPQQRDVRGVPTRRRHPSTRASP